MNTDVLKELVELAEASPDGSVPAMAGLGLFVKNRTQLLKSLLSQEAELRELAETQAVAWLIRGPEKGNYTTHFATVLPVEAEQWRQKPDCMVTPLYRSPVESVPVSELEKLVEEWRETASRTDADKRYAGHLRKCADRLSAVIRGTKT